MVVEPKIDIPADPRIKKILIMKWSALGDIVIASAIIEDIRNAFPNAEIDLNAIPPWDRLLFAEDRRFKRVLTVDLRGRERGWRGIVRWLRMISKGNYDLLIDLQTNSRSRLLISLLTLSGRCAPFRLSIHRKFPYNVAPAPVAGGGHIFDLQRRALQFAGIPTSCRRPVLAVSAANRKNVERLLKSHRLADYKYSVFFPGSSPSGLLKRWGAHRYAALADALSREGLGPAVLVGGPDDLEECAAIERIAREAGSVVNLCGETEILDIVPLAEKARVIVGNDTGPTHVSSASDRPLVVICGPTDPRRVKPLGDNVVAVQAELGCVNCYQKECDHHSCMEQVSVGMILGQVRSMLSGSDDA